MCGGNWPRPSSPIRPGLGSAVVEAFDSRAVCVRRCTHSFRWCLVWPGLVRLFASFHSISSSSSLRSHLFSLLSPVQIISPFLLLFRGTSHTHIYFINAWFFSLLRRQQHLFFISFFSRLLISRSAHNALMKICSSTTNTTWKTRRRRRRRLSLASS